MLFVVRGLALKAVLGLNFLQKYAAKIDILNRKLILYTYGCKSVHSLTEKEMELRSVQMVTTEKVKLAPRTQTRIECKIGEVEDGTHVYFESSQEVENLAIAVAGAVDIIHNGCITTRIVNPTFEKFILRPGTIIGQIEVVPEKGKESTTRCKNKYATDDTTEWLLHMDVGESEHSENEVKRVKVLLLNYKVVFSQIEYNIGSSDGQISNRIFWLNLKSFVK